MLNKFRQEHYVLRQLSKTVTLKRSPAAVDKSVALLLMMIMFGQLNVEKGEKIYTTQFPKDGPVARERSEKIET